MLTHRRDGQEHRHSSTEHRGTDFGDTFPVIHKPLNPHYKFPGTGTSPTAPNYRHGRLSAGGLASLLLQDPVLTLQARRGWRLSPPSPAARCLSQDHTLMQKASAQGATFHCGKDRHTKGYVGY